jgi:hypothetical protein
MDRARGRHSGLALAVVALLLGLSLDSLGLNEPAAVAGPSVTVPSAHLRNGVCGVSGLPPATPGHAPLVIAPHPAGLTIRWLPGLNSKTCVVAMTHAGAAPAAALARAITRAAAVPNSPVFNCPEDDGTKASVSFTYAHHRSPPPLVVGLSGCQFVSQSGRVQKRMTAGANRVLASLAPCAWQRYLTGGTPRC